MTTVVALWPFSVAVMIAEGALVAVRAPVVAENVVVLSPECTAALAGMLSAGLLL
jgi:hypothetical protein